MSVNGRLIKLIFIFQGERVLKKEFKFHLWHPFLYYIWDRSTNTTFLSGQITKFPVVKTKFKTTPEPLRGNWTIAQGAKNL